MERLTTYDALYNPSMGFLRKLMFWKRPSIKAYVVLYDGGKPRSYMGKAKSSLFSPFKVSIEIEENALQMPKFVKERLAELLSKESLTPNEKRELDLLLSNSDQVVVLR